MKKIVLLIAIAIGIMQISQAQFQRKALLEEFTQASCGPCAAQNPGFNTVLLANENDAVWIKYQVWWPGYDPMYLQNSDDVDARVAFYNVTGVPDASIDGVHVVNDCGYYDGAPACVSQDDIDNENVITSPFQITVTHSFSADYKTIYVHVDVQAGPAMTGDLRLQTVVTEEEIDFTSPPGSNGETEFYGVMKKMLPGTDGTITGDFAAGETKSYDLQWDMSNIYNLNNVMVVAFMQDGTTKEVYQAEKSAPIGGLPAINYTASSAATVSCESTVSPVVSVTNSSADPLTSLEIDYSIDGGSMQVYNWAGSIDAGATSQISLPSTTLSGSSHTIDVTIVPPTGVVDLNMVDNSVSGPINIFSNVYPGVDEGFEGGAFPPTDWALANLADGSGWIKGTGAGGYGESSTSSKADFYYISAGAVFDMDAARLDLSGFGSDVTLSFDRAYARYADGYDDELKIMVSSDCGLTWSTIYDKHSDDLATAPDHSSAFKPTSTQWATDDVNLGAYAGMSSVLVKFEAISGYGNELWIDNVRIGNATAIQDQSWNNSVQVYPNPASDAFTLDLNLVTTTDITLNLYSVDGKLIQSRVMGSLDAGRHTITFNTATIASGLYNLVINANGANVENKSVVINK